MAIDLLLILLLSIYSTHDLIYSRSMQKTNLGFKGTFSLVSGKGPYPPDPKEIDFEIINVTENCVRVQFYDPQKEYVSIPGVLQDSETQKSIKNAQYDFEFPENGGIMIKRKDSGEIIFDTHSLRREHPLVFEDQFLSLTTTIGNDPVIYGLGQRRSRFALKYPFNYTINSADRGTPADDQNLYGYHPFHIEVRPDGKSHGIFFFNSAPMQVELQNGWMTYRAMAGERLDFFIFLGPTMKDVIKQYTDLIGKPALVPQWATGIHQCAWGYKNLSVVKEVVKDYEKNGFPLDVMWADIDYMDEKKLFTTDPEKYPREEFVEFIKDIKKNRGIHYVAIIDPGVKVEEGYRPYDDLIKSKGYILNRTNKPFIGKVWPGRTIFPDFTSKQGEAYWIQWIERFVRELSLDGLWTDMNEISNFCKGECEKDEEETKYAWIPDVLNVQAPPPDALTEMGPYYLTHNLYAHYENLHTSKSLQNVYPGKRPFILSRASYAGSGKTNFIWLGDNEANSSDLYDSISGILSSGLFGLPFVGCDVAGFYKNADSRLFTRWVSTATFLYPFFRNHRAWGTRPQEFYRFGEPFSSYNLKFLRERQKIQSYWYTLMHQSHDEGIPMVRPLAMEFPEDVNCRKIDKQAMLGDALLISPVLDEKNDFVSDCYFPHSRWYDYWTGREAKELEVNDANENREDRPPFEGINLTVSSEGVSNVTIKANISTIPVHIRGGYIFTKQNHTDSTLMNMRNSPLTVVVALGYDGRAKGSVTVDDGDSMDDKGDCAKTVVDFEMLSEHKKNVRIFRASTRSLGYFTNQVVDEIRILGLDVQTTAILFSDMRSSTFHYDSSNNVLVIRRKSVKSHNEWKLTQEFNLYILSGEIASFVGVGRDYLTIIIAFVFFCSILGLWWRTFGKKSFAKRGLNEE
ncbi:alpha-glucosidase [Monocercomonoides exilis]|uniref:alpha-glucosidase n=1 Tax=Monocercomonoides exilis TaxID=2049356 RepID=UPI0035597B86|nr:alpha-glucosidase [Monocercomonoides exilis]|eukprot:MONOS_16014.1-p1 / transcript=MONOS_16014.1 / gene=MONOS_16014 / organism=Monocercomonoides_exilis_PA203 / gene_product=alpha-glucosidase / transcript_product=alpha-glucosidase / location=Mono_scaffold01459:4823-7555(+) / protein_length=911 / sequence_SO=supercontig / SO=protein_coding / is_pseudo=false